MAAILSRLQYVKKMFICIRSLLIVDLVPIFSLMFIYKILGNFLIWSLLSLWTGDAISRDQCKKDVSNSIANALELRLSCTKPLKW